MVYLSIRKISLMMFSLLLTILSCIPREDPPEKVLYLDHVNTLPQALIENSGMITLEDIIWYINDSGNEPVIYGYSQEQNTVIRTVVVKNTQNIDWEDITQNDGFVFIGDFGNNEGSRNDLRIISINKSDLLSDADTVIPYGYITFHYADQSEFTPAPQATPFDCEAFVASDEELILFTKDWVTRQTRVYTVPVVPGDYAAEFMDQWNVEGLVTAAAWSEEDQVLMLLGYTPLIPFIWDYSGFNNADITYESEKRTDFADLLGVQAEGMLITENGSVLVSSETNTTLNIPASLYILRER